MANIRTITITGFTDKELNAIEIVCNDLGMQATLDNKIVIQILEREFAKTTTCQIGIYLTRIAKALVGVK